MNVNRRQMILCTTALVSTILTERQSAAQAPSVGDGFRDTFGTPNYGAPSASMQFLKRSQEQRTIVPRDREQLDAYITRLPVLRQMQETLTPELYHLMQWNAFCLDMTSLDHTTEQTGFDQNGKPLPDPLYAEQIGPHRSSRALAIVHLAMFEAVNAIYRRAQSYHGIQQKVFSTLQLTPSQVDPTTASVRAAIGSAAHRTLVALYPKKQTATDLFYRKITPLIGDSPEVTTAGVRIGTAAANLILADRNYQPSTGRFADGSEVDDNGAALTKGPNNSLDLEPSALKLFPHPTSTEWQIDPITKVGRAIGGYWHNCRPFVLDPKALFIPNGPPAANSAAFQKSYEDVRQKGGDPNPVPLGARRNTPTTRTGGPNDPLDGNNETFKANFWAYDGTALLCAPPRLYNMIATSIALDEHKIEEVAEMARYLALVNVALADAGIAAWTAKYKFHFARPVTYFRNNDPNHVEMNVANKDWTPLGAPVSNGTPDGANLTPPFPSYPSGHAVFGGALFRTLQRLLPVDAAPFEKFSFVSDEYNGLNRGPTGDPRPRVERTFASFAEAEQENARSRIFLGIHWQFDADDGIAQGHAVADYILGHALQPI